MKNFITFILGLAFIIAFPWLAIAIWLIYAILSEAVKEIRIRQGETK